MKLRDKILFYLSVPKCTCCKRRLSIDERALCADCKTEYDNTVKRNCSICARPLYECTCTNEYLDAHYVHTVIKVFRYIIQEGLPTNSLIYSLKRENRRDVLDFLSDELANSIQDLVKAPEGYIITSVPRTSKSVVKYGIDHAELLAKAVAKKVGAKYIKSLISKSKAQQKHAGSREERIKNTDFRIRKSADKIQGRNVIIIDDIITTGASMGHAAMLLKGIGAKKIIGAALAIAYKDSYVRFDISDRFK